MDCDNTPVCEVAGEGEPSAGNVQKPADGPKLRVVGYRNALWKGMESLHKSYKTSMQACMDVQDLQRSDLWSTQASVLLHGARPVGFVLFREQPNNVIYIKDLYCEIKGQGHLLLDHVKSRTIEGRPLTALFLLAPSRSDDQHQDKLVHYFCKQGFYLPPATCPIDTPKTMQSVLSSERALNKPLGKLLKWEELRASLQQNNSLVMICEPVSCLGRQARKAKAKGR